MTDGHRDDVAGADGRRPVPTTPPSPRAIANVLRVVRWVALDLHGRGDPLAHELADAVRALAPLAVEPPAVACPGCGAAVEPQPRGRPRRWCRTCRPPESRRKSRVGRKVEP